VLTWNLVRIGRNVPGIKEAKSFGGPPLVTNGFQFCSNIAPRESNSPPPTVMLEFDCSDISSTKSMNHTYERSIRMDRLVMKVFFMTGRKNKILYNKAKYVSGPFFQNGIFHGGGGIFTAKIYCLHHIIGIIPYDFSD